jgi:SAM-dependent methyltransferase
MDEQGRQSARPEDWDLSYLAAGNQRLWPEEPTIKPGTDLRGREGGLDLGLWKTGRIGVVLDAGCGDGKNLAFLSEEGFFPIGVDVSPHALAKCKSFMEERGNHERYFLLAPTKLFDMPIPDEALGAAICIDVLGHNEAPQRILREIWRVLRPGGYLYTTVFHPDDSSRNDRGMEAIREPHEYWYTPPGASCKYYYHFYTEDQARRLFESSDFGVQTLGPRRWREKAHEGYREYPHEHESWFSLLRKPDRG